MFAPRQKIRIERYQPTNLTAAAARVTSRNGQDFRRLIQPWQARALSYYRLIGEVWYSAQFYSRALSKTRLFPAILDENGDPQETDDKLLLDLWSRVQGPGGGQAHLQAQYGRLMFLTGEGYLTASPDDVWGEVWEFLSSDELRVQPGGYFMRYTAPQLDALTLVDAPDDSFEVMAGQSGPDAIIPYRIWRPDPGYSAWADSPMRAVLEICKEIMTLTLAVEARATSRAANSGLLLWPDETSNPQLDTSGDEDATNDPFFNDLAESFMAPITNPGSASAGPPMLVRMSKNLIRPEDGGPRLMQLIDPKDNYGETGLRNECIRRFALGVDMPPEQLLGMTDANHWSGWLVDEQTYKAHLMPVTQQMCDDFNSAYLLPAAREAGYTDWKKVRVGYDATEVINHPDKGKDFLDLYNARAISKAALRAAKGAEEADAMPEDELNEAIGVALRDGSFVKYGYPQVRAAAIEPSAGELEETAGGQTTEATGGPVSGADQEAGPPAAGEPEPRQPITASALRILGQADMAVERCRELAGQRLIRHVRNAQCAPCLERIADIQSDMVASALGQQAADDLGTPGASELVSGGTRSFITSIRRLGVTPEAASHLAEIVEHHAARTLHDETPPALPASFQSMLQRLTVAA